MRRAVAWCLVAVVVFAICISGCKGKTASKDAPPENRTPESMKVTPEAMKKGR